MPRGTEDVLQEELWSWLRNQGYEVAGEVGVGNGTVDLVAKDDTEYLGFELKTVYGLERQAGLSFRKVALTLKQIRKYVRSSNFDRFYFCCETPKRVKRRMSDVRNSSIYQFGISRSILNQLGLIQVSLASDVDIEIVEQAGKLIRTETPELPQDNEGWVNHYAWEWALNRKGIATQEGFLPGDYYVDISAFEGSSDPTEVLKNQDQYSHVGIESKGVEGLRPHHELGEQLRNYITSGGLTHLYLAVPKQSDEQAYWGAGQQVPVSIDNTEIPQKVGIIAVDKMGEVQISREPKRLKMEYDGIRWSDSEYVPVGWGARDKQKRRRSIVFHTGTIITTRYINE